jgi:TonB family protein
MRSTYWLGVLAAMLALAGVTTSRVDAQDCAHPNVPARVLHPVIPDTPTMAAHQGISGMVRVQVSLDADSHVVALKIYSSANARLNNAALWAARRSAFQTAVVNCKPIATNVLFTVEFDSSDRPRPIFTPG